MHVTRMALDACAVAIALFLTTPAAADQSQALPLARLQSGQTEVGDFYGWTVDLEDGVLAVGSPILKPDAAGGVFLYDATTASPVGFLAPPLISADGLYFGSNVALDQGDLVVGERLNSASGRNRGKRAYYYRDAELLPTSIIERPEIANPFGNAVEFGSSIAVHDGKALVGYLNGDLGSATIGAAGSAHLYDLASGERLLDLAPESAELFLDFGASVALNDRYAVVTSLQLPTAYVFDAQTGEELRSIERIGSGVLRESEFINIVIDGDLAVVTATRAQEGMVFDLRTGEFLRSLRSDSAVSDSFGASIDVDDGIVVIGDPFKDAAFVFDIATGLQLTTLTANNADRVAAFGASVAIDGETVAVGAIRGQEPNAGQSSGSVYLFRLVPEPSAAFLAAFYGLAVCLRRRHPRTCPVPETTYL